MPPEALFDLETPPVPGPAYVQVAVDRAAGVIDKELTYAVPEGLRGTLQIGHAVAVGLRGGRAVAYVTGFPDSIDFEAAQLKSIGPPLAPAPLFDATALKLAHWIAAYYHCPLADCLSLFIQAGSVPSLESKYAFVAPEPLRALRDLARSPKLLAIATAVHEAGKPLGAKAISKIIGSKAENAQLRHLCELEVLGVAEETSHSNVKPRRVLAVRLKPRGREFLRDEVLEKLHRSAPRQVVALREVAARDGAWVGAKTLYEAAGVELGTLRGLEKKDAIEFGDLESMRAPAAAPRRDARLHLSAEQQAAVAVIGRSLNYYLHPEPEPESGANSHEPPPNTILLQGVTASGKTEVYLAAIERCLQLGRRAMVLVPEIALTAQTVEIFQGRFGSKVAILHSALGAGERYDEWRRAGSGGAQIIVGARSALFAPCRNVGLIIIDEEHDHSYKQDATPRYHARDVAAKRCAMEGAVLLLGSATPSLESYARAIRGEYGHVLMTKRVADRALPDVEIVDLSNEVKGGVMPVLSSRLKDALCDTVAAGKQAIVFLNRRGFATYVQCLSCGNVEKCPNCDVSLTHHKREGLLRCHHCDHQMPVPGKCPRCEGWLIGFTGTGTEKVEAEVEALFAERGLENARILRLDRDTTAAKGAHAKILGDFRTGKAQVLIGTQMVTKGLDFPNVTLVGVISADTALNVPDFRAAERTFQLLSQVSGRAGRGDSPGRVMIQTLAPDDYAITSAAAHEYTPFVERELELRSAIPNPPFSHIVNIISQDENEAAAKDRITKVANRFIAAIGAEGTTTVLGPVSCPISRVKNRFRFHLMLRDKSRPRLHKVLAIYDELPRELKEGLTVDVDAMTIL